MSSNLFLIEKLIEFKKRDEVNRDRSGTPCMFAMHLIVHLSLRDMLRTRLPSTIILASRVDLIY